MSNATTEEDVKPVPTCDAGPWRWAKNGSDWMLVTAHGGQKVILAPGRKGELVVRDQARCTLIPFDPAHPNALVIEMAPELLAACRKALAAIRGLSGAVDALAGPTPGFTPADDVAAELERVIKLATRA